MVATGVNVFRINFSHADYDDVKKRVQYIREINEEHGYNASRPTFYLRTNYRQKISQITPYL